MARCATPTPGTHYTALCYAVAIAITTTITITITILYYTIL